MLASATDPRPAPSWARKSRRVRGSGELWEQRVDIVHVLLDVVGTGINNTRYSARVNNAGVKLDRSCWTFRCHGRSKAPCLEASALTNSAGGVGLGSSEPCHGSAVPRRHPMRRILAIVIFSLCMTPSAFAQPIVFPDGTTSDQAGGLMIIRK